MEEAEAATAIEPGENRIGPEKGTIFVSHSSTDNEWVNRLTSLLSDRGYVVTHDNNSFDFNQPLPSQIRRLIDKASHVIVLVSPDASDSNWVKREIEYAGKVEEERPDFHIFPLLLQSATTTDLRKIFKLVEPDSDTPLEDYPEEKLAIRVPGDPPRIDHIIGELVDRIEGKGGPGGRRTWAILDDLETGAGNADAARGARAKAMAAYEAARRDGWQIIESTQRHVVMAGQALQSGDPGEVEALQTQLLPKLARSGHPTNVALADVLGHLLAGSRDPGLAEHPGLFSCDAVEVKLLLEALAAAEG